MWNLKTTKINFLTIFIPLLITVSFLISLVVHSYFFSISYYFLLFPNLFFMFSFHTMLDHFPCYLNFYLSYSMLYFFPSIFFYPSYFYLYSLYLSFIPLIVILFLLSFFRPLPCSFDHDSFSLTIDSPLHSLLYSALRIFSPLLFPAAIHKDIYV